MMQVRSLRAEHARALVASVGFACFLAMNSFSLWGFSLLTQTTLGAEAAEWWVEPLAYSNALSFFVFAIGAYKAPRVFDRDPLTAAMLLLAMAAILLNGYMSIGSLPMLATAGVCMGLGTTCCFFCWARSFRRDGAWYAKIEIVAGSVLSILPFLAFLCLDSSAIVFTLSLLALCNLCALAGHRRIEGVAGGVGEVRPLREVMAHSWKPLLCVAMVGLMAPIVSGLTQDPTDTAGFIQQAVTIHSENVCAVVILGIAWFALKRPTRIESSFMVLFPVLATALLLFSVSGEVGYTLVPYIGGVAFVIFSILAVTESVFVSTEKDLSITVVYGLYAGTLYCANQLGGVVVALLDDVLMEETSVIGVMLALLYCSSIVLFAVTRKEKAAETPDAPSPVEQPAPAEAPASAPEEVDPVDAACQRLIAEHGFSERQAEVLTYLAHGYDVPTIAKKLYLSENTIRTHVKKIYTALDVHSKQEIIELVNAPRGQ